MKENLVLLDDRNRLVEKHLPLVGPIAASILRGLPPSFELDDLVGSGTVGLIDAAVKFDGIRPFEHFARCRIRWAILDSIRRREYAEQTHAPLTDCGGVVQNRIQEDIEQDELVASIERATRELPELCRRVVQLRYTEELTMDAIGTRIGVSKSTVVRLHQKALPAIRSHLQQAA